MIPWNNMYLIPIVLVGGLIAFFFGRTLLLRQRGNLNRSGRLLAKPSLAERKEELAVKFLSAEDELMALERRLREQDEEEARRIRLMDEARKRSRSNNVLVGKLDVPVNAGPLTTAIQVNEELLATLKAARDKQS